MGERRPCSHSWIAGVRALRGTQEDRVGEKISLQVPHLPTAEQQLKMLWSRSFYISVQMLPSVKCLLKRCVILPPRGCPENLVVRPSAWACKTSRASWDPGPRQGAEATWPRCECGQVLKPSMCACVCLCTRTGVCVRVIMHVCACTITYAACKEMQI